MEVKEEDHQRKGQRNRIEEKIMAKEKKKAKKVYKKAKMTAKSMGGLVPRSMLGKGFKAI